ncbi:hypothetical protein [Bordetella sp. 15P40C-2]|uniref:hypothetical protein n=1 Tax=Bordetella sp. 15P40C-2 TaxID=2572246 RepID=UPI0013287DDB|nr:hypothetical protein [Bordetella sp. 15P40C-2]MVW72883.1 hypothetical protein [Bordetella sp. 15P40C-2]
MSIYLSPDLDPNQPICRLISFYDLVELTTCGKLFFDEQSDAMPHSVALPRKAGLEQAVDVGQHGRAERWALESMLRPCQRAPVRYQSWSLVGDDVFLNFPVHEVESSSSVYVFASVQRLVDSLFVRDDVDVIVSPYGEKDLQSDVLDRRSSSIKSLMVALRAAVTGSDYRQIALDLRMFLSGVVVPPTASARFVKVVSDLVQRITDAPVSRLALR